MKTRITITAEVDSVEAAKELLDNLEVLKENYYLIVSLTISPPVRFGE